VKGKLQFFSMQGLITKKFTERFGSTPAFIVRAPGRVNLIGDHTDYNLGFSLPMAIDRATWIALRARPDRQVLLYSIDFPHPANFILDNIHHSEGWSDYVHGMAWALLESGFPLHGWEGVLASDIPVASGLSSSAALELSVARAFWALTRWEWDGVEMAQVARMNENEWLGLKSGILDQMISAMGVQGKAFLFDFRDLSLKAVPLPEGTTVVAMNTKIQRKLVDSVYNDRVAQCRQAAAMIGVESLRDVSLQDLLVITNGLDAVLHRRVRHVITENARTLAGEEKLIAGDAVAFGALMNENHASLRDDYEVSCVELDLMVELALKQPGCFGARMTGAGFGGCAIALVGTSDAEAFSQKVTKGYEKKTGILPEMYLCQPSEGAKIVYEA
jgi:galactokinase